MSETMKTRSAGGVVINSHGLVLVVSQRGTSWSLPKGHIENGESELDAAKREVREESGIEHLVYVRDLGNYDRYKIGENGDDDLSEIKSIYMFLFRTEEVELKPLDEHNPEALWVKADAVADLLTHRRDKEFFLQLKEKI